MSSRCLIFHHRKIRATLLAVVLAVFGHGGNLAKAFSPGGSRGILSVRPAAASILMNRCGSSRYPTLLKHKIPGKSDSAFLDANPDEEPLSSSQYDKMGMQLHLQRVLAAKDAMHRAQLDNVTKEHGDYKRVSQRLQVETFKKGEQKANALLQKITKLESELKELKEATNRQSLKNQDSQEKRMQVEAEFAHVKKAFKAQVQKLECANTHERIALTQDRAKAIAKVEGLQKQVQTIENREYKRLTELKERRKWDLAAMDTQSKSQLQMLREAKEKEIQKLQSKLEKEANDWQEDKLTTHRQHLWAFKAASEQISKLEILLEDQREATKCVNLKARSNWEKYTESEAELAELQKDYSKATKKWQELLTQEQQTHAKGQAATTKRLEEFHKLVESSEEEKKQLQLDFQHESAEKDAEHQKKTTELKASKDAEIKFLQTRLETTTIEWQSYKLELHQQQVDAIRAAARDQEALLQQITELQAAVDCQKEMITQEQMNTQFHVRREHNVEAKASVYQKHISDLQSSHLKEIQTQQSKLELLSSEYDAYKSQTQQKQATVRATWEEQEQVLSRQIVDLQSALSDQEERTKREEAARQELLTKHSESDRKLSQLKQEYKDVVLEWDTAYSREQETRTKNQLTASKKLGALEELGETKEQEKIQLRLAHQRELTAVDVSYRRKITKLQIDKDEGIKALQLRLENMAEDHRKFKLAAERERMATDEITNRGVDGLSIEIEALKGTLQEQTETTELQDLNAEESWENRTRLEAYMGQLQNDATRADKDWELAYALERCDRIEDQTVAAKRIQSLNEKAADINPKKLESKDNLQELAAKDDYNQQQISDLQVVKAEEIERLQSKLEKVTNEYETYKSVDGQLQREPQTSDAAETSKSETLEMRELAKKSKALEEELLQVRVVSTKAIQDLEERHERERHAWTQGQSDVGKDLEMLNEEAMEYAKTIKEQSQQELERIRNEFASELAQKDAILVHKNTLIAQREQELIGKTKSATKAPESRASARQTDHARQELGARLAEKEAAIEKVKRDLAERDFLIAKWLTERESITGLTWQTIKLLKSRLTMRGGRWKTDLNKVSHIPTAQRPVPDDWMDLPDDFVTDKLTVDGITSHQPLQRIKDLVWRGVGSLKGSLSTDEEVDPVLEPYTYKRMPRTTVTL